ncbi:MAG: efflux RND transporter periplasmic adaptor subunit [Proteobacteria bacterium]|nr:efflux RND transporter periplasmic adaptor subunit [Pseudomonadota bacterium]
MKKRRGFHIALTIVFLFLGLLGTIILVKSKPALEKQRPPAAVPMVRTIEVNTVPQTVHILGEGTVRPQQEISLVPQVSGKIIYLSPAMVNGGQFSKGEVLLRIEPIDYELTVTLARAKVKEAESRLELSEEDSAAAREEWLTYNSDGSNANREPPPLVAKTPQLAAAKAGLDAERADLRKALLNLERTTLTAPFDGRVAHESVDIGQYVAPGQALAVLYSTDAAEIALPLEDEDLFWFHVPGFTPGAGPGSSATISAGIAGQELSWTGKVVRAQGKLDERTRMINVVVRVEKPYRTKPPLAAGLFVTVDIEGHTLPHATLVPRSTLRRDEVVWVVDDKGRLHFRKVDVARTQGDNILIREGLKNNEIVIVSPLKAVTDNMLVRPIPVKEGKR